VGLARKRNPVSEALQRHLEKKFHLVVERFAKLKSDGATPAVDRMLCQGEVAGPLWAVCTHRAVSAETRQRAYTDVHMLSHQVGAGRPPMPDAWPTWRGERRTQAQSHPRWPPCVGNWLTCRPDWPGGMRA
jgi:hypothetical protein